MKDYLLSNIRSSFDCPCILLCVQNKSPAVGWGGGKLHRKCSLLAMLFMCVCLWHTEETLEPTVSSPSWIRVCENVFAFKCAFSQCIPAFQQQENASTRETDSYGSQENGKKTVDELHL